MGFRRKCAYISWVDQLLQMTVNLKIIWTPLFLQPWKACLISLLSGLLKLITFLGMCAGSAGPGAQQSLAHTSEKSFPCKISSGFPGIRSTAGSLSESGSPWAEDRPGWRGRGRAEGSLAAPFLPPFHRYRAGNCWPFLNWASSRGLRQQGQVFSSWWKKNQNRESFSSAKRSSLFREKPDMASSFSHKDVQYFFLCLSENLPGRSLKVPGLKTTNISALSQQSWKERQRHNPGELQWDSTSWSAQK